MNDSKIHQDYAMEYKRLTQLWKRHNMVAGIQQIGTIGLLYFLTNMEIGYVKPLGAFLGLLFVFFLGRDYMVSKFLDQKVVSTVLDGLKLEKKNPKFEKFFHDIVGKFSIVKILVTRSVSTVFCVVYLTFRMNEIFFGSASHADTHRFILGGIASLLGAVLCTLYYRCYRPLEDAKAAI